MSFLTENPRDAVNKTFDQGIDLKPGDKEDVPANRKKDDPTPAEDEGVALKNKKVDPHMANSADQVNEGSYEVSQLKRIIDDVTKNPNDDYNIAKVQFSSDGGRTKWLNVPLPMLKEMQKLLAKK